VVELQIISKVIESHDYSIIEDNSITAEYFEGTGYEAEFEFVQDHYAKFGNVPDKATFLSHFPDIELVSVSESDKYLISTLKEECLFRKSVPVVQNIGKLLQTDANQAVEYMLSSVKSLQPNYDLGGVDLIADASVRLEHYKDRVQHQDEWYFTSGFPELDEVIHGIQRGEEFFVIFARTNQCKSWVLEKIITHIWETGANVGYISPEMGADSIGYRFDTLFKNFSNKDLMWGRTDIDLSEYEKYIQELKSHKNKFIVSTPADFGNRITVGKLKNFIKQHNLEAIAVDGITYMTDERGKHGDNKTTSLTNISEDLMSLSVELNVPVFVVVQANRGGVVDGDKDGTPELESIRDSDGISHNASKIISLRQHETTLEICVKKQRNGIVGTRLKYDCDINTGMFTYIPDYEEQRQPQEQKKKTKPIGKDVF
jgi:replicative DNA helicase